MSDITTEAAEWLVRLSEEDPPPTEQQIADFEHWLNANPRHREAVVAMQDMIGSLKAMPSTAAHAALEAGKSDAAQGSGQSLSKILGLVFALLVPLYFLSPSQTLDIWLADKRTENNEWQSWTLTDSSILRLSGNSAVEVDFDPTRRRLHLLQGELLIDVAKDSHRPLEVITEHGRFRALGTRFVVQRKAGFTVLTVLESEVLVQLDAGKNSQQEITISAGEQLSVYENRVSQTTRLDTEKFERNWRTGKFVVSGQRLSHVLDKLSHYHRGHWLYDRKSLAHINVMAVLPLDDPERALQLLSESLPIEVNHYSPWLTHIVPKKNP